MRVVHRVKDEILFSDKEKLKNDAEYLKVAATVRKVHNLTFLLNVATVVANFYILRWLAKAIHSLAWMKLP